MFRRSLPFQLCLLATGCRNTGSHEALSPAGVLTRVIAADNRGDLDGVLACYADDAVLIPPRGSRVAGREAIRTRYEDGFARYRFELRCETSELRVDGAHAWARGETRGVLLSRAGEGDVRVQDAFLAVLQQEPDGRWCIARLAWSAASDVSSGPGN